MKPIKWAYSAAPHSGADELRDTADGRRRCRRCSARRRRNRGFSRAGGALQRFGAHRARWREQKALAEAHVVIEEIDHRAFSLDVLGDEIDAEAAEEVGEIGR